MTGRGRGGVVLQREVIVGAGGGCGRRCQGRSGAVKAELHAGVKEGLVRYVVVGGGVGGAVKAELHA